MMTSIFENYGLDLFSFAISALMLLAYQIYLAHKTRQHPEYTVQAVNRIARSAWVETIMRESDKEVLAGFEACLAHSACVSELVAYLKAGCINVFFVGS